MTAKPVKHPCSKCDGRCRIDGFGHVAGGVCFRCNGTGYQLALPSRESLKWYVFGFDRHGNEWFGVHIVWCRTAEEAIAHAKAKPRDASYRAKWDLSQACAVPHDILEEVYRDAEAAYTQHKAQHLL